MLELSRRPSPSNSCNKQTMTDSECTGKVRIESPKIKQEEKGITGRERTSNPGQAGV